MDNNTRATRSEAEEFNAFNATSSASAGEAQKPPKRPAPQKQNPQGKSGGINKNIIIAAIVGVLVLLLVAGIVVVAMTRDHHILKEDNAYLVYTDSNGYHLLSNGQEIEKDFEGEVKIEVAADNSFAYVTEEVDGEFYIYLLKGKKLEPITTSAVEQVVAYAALKPGVVYKHRGSFRLYSEKYGVETITKKAAENFLISSDASTVVYTAPKNDAADVNEMIVFQDGANTTLNSKNNCVPAAVSNYGDYIYASFVNDEAKKLSVFTTKDLDNPQGEVIAETDGFVGILAQNVKGDEILLLTSIDGTTEDEETEELIPTIKTHTKIYRYSKKGEHSATKLAEAVMLPMSANPDIVFFDDFSEVYLTAYRPENFAQRAIYYMDKKYEPSRIAKYTLPEGIEQDSCTLSPDENYLYYINNDKDLIQMDLESSTYNTKELGFGVNEFYVTQKGNIYYLDESGELFFREPTAKRNTPIADFVTDISFYRYSNTLFFTKEEGENIFSSKEGSDEDIVKMGDAQVTALPEFYNTNSKQSYAAYYDSMDNSGILLYTSNGKRFKMITNDCLTINGNEISDITGDDHETYEDNSNGVG